MKPVASLLGGLLSVPILGGVLGLSTGMVVGASGQSDPATAPTFAKDVAPILQDKCQSCHRPESMAPMSLLTYQDVRPWAKAIKNRVVAREMPPWLVDPHVGANKFKNDPSLSEKQIATIAAWVDAGAPQGNPADMPPPKQFLDAYTWELGKPDLVVELPQPNLIKANDPNWWGDFYTESGLTEDRYVRAVQSLPGPGAARIVHHMHAYLIQDTNGDGVEEEMHLNEYAMGKGAERYPEGTGKLFKAGARVKFNLHYAANNNNKDTVDRARVGVWFYPKGVVPKHTIIVTPTAQNNETLDLPPNTSEVRNDGYEVMDSAIRVTGFQPHMHNRGRRQCLEAIYPTGRAETLICTNWDFGWHIQYLFEDDVQPILPKGSIIHQISWYDNSKANKWNPDPNNWVGYGRRSSDEMSFVWLGYYKISDEEYDQIRKDRAAKSKLSTSTND